MTAMDEMHREMFAIRLDADPKASKSEIRSNAAAKQIPDYTGKLIQEVQDGRSLKMQQVYLLYQEYRQYWRSKRPFKRELPPINCGSPLGTEHDLRVLEELSYPEKLDRQCAYLLLWGLWFSACSREMIIY